MENDGTTFKVPYMENQAIVFQDGPYGLWKIKLERGQTPVAFLGEFTSPSMAVSVVKIYEENKKSKG